MKKVSIIGYSDIARRRVIPAIQNLKNFELHKIGRHDFFNSCNEEFNFCSYNEVFKCADTDIVYISTPPSLHFHHSLIALQNGKHVLVEKPASLLVSEWDILSAEANKHGLIIREALSFEYHPIISGITQFYELNSQSIQEINVVFRFPKLSENNIRNNKSLGGGIINDALVYPLVFLQKIGAVLERGLENIHIVMNSCGVSSAAYLSLNYCDCRVNIMVGMGYSYKNSVEFVCDNFTAFVPKLFSLRPDEFGLLIKNQQELLAEFTPVDQVEIMIDSFFKESHCRSSFEQVKERIIILEKLNKIK